MADRHDQHKNKNHQGGSFQLNKHYDSVLDQDQRKQGRIEGTNIYEQKYNKDNE